MGKTVIIYSNYDIELRVVILEEDVKLVEMVHTRLGCSRQYVPL